jgi:translation initiation factor IF-3
MFIRIAAALLFRPAALSVIHKCHIPQLVTVPVRYVAHRAPNPRNHDIPHHIVQLVNEEGRLEPHTSLSHLIASIDPQSHYIELVTEHPQPVVKIRDKGEQYHKLKEWKKKQKTTAASNVQKEIQMTWGVESGDLAHKLSKARKELEKGNRVELVFAPKANQRFPSPALVESRINETVEKMAEFAKEWMPRKVERGVAILYLKKLDMSSKPIKPS